MGKKLSQIVKVVPNGGFRSTLYYQDLTHKHALLAQIHESQV